MPVSVERISYKGWENCWEIANGDVRLVVTADVGPRIIHFGFVGAENQLYEVADDAGKRGGDKFRMYGGHRLWVAPETERTDFPDNLPVDVVPYEFGARFTAPMESTNLQKEIDITLSESGTSIEVVHRISNRGKSATTLAPWALSVMKPGGRVILPLPPRAPHGPEHLLPATSVALWSYTDLSAPCWEISPKYIQLIQPLAAAQGFGMQKIGMRNTAGWGAYFRDGSLFVKQTSWREGPYEDFGSNYETFANEKFIELETLGLVQELASGQSCEHRERWRLWRDVDESGGEEWIDEQVLRRIQSK
ncbi:MAG: uncharacterized protein JWO13_2575 [Acidobacteriales bacterium]|nr:uncharacterized protein [Terriglobales bacterium]